MVWQGEDGVCHSGRLRRARRDGGGNSLGCGEIHVAPQALGRRVGADVDDRLARGEAVRAQKPRVSGGGDDDIRAAATPGRSRVREWQSVTVASRAVSSIASGRPTTRLRPTTATRFPAGSMP